MPEKDTTKEQQQQQQQQGETANTEQQQQANSTTTTTTTTTASELPPSPPKTTDTTAEKDSASSADGSSSSSSNNNNNNKNEDNNNKHSELDELTQKVTALSVEEKETAVQLLPEKEEEEKAVSPPLQALASWMQDGTCDRILVLSGAGVSVASGIPDFRTKDTGLVRVV